MVAIGIVGTLFVLGFAVCDRMRSSLDNLGDVPARKHLAAIPVSPRVCPYVRVMHAAANDFERVNPFDNLALIVGPPAPPPWPTERARLEKRLNVLRFAVAVSRPQFPPRIRRKLGIVLESITTAWPKLQRAKDPFDAVARVENVWSTGEYAFGDASDLIGNACGVHLAASV